MRFAFVPTMILAGSFSLVAAQSATAPPNLAPNKTDQMRPPSPATNVNVLNFPEVQAVEGTVAVSSLPAMQTVGGTVSVGNFPAAAPALQPRFVNLFEGDTALLGFPGQTFDAVDTTGYRRVGIHIVSSGPSGRGGRVLWGWGDHYDSVWDASNGASTANCVQPLSAERILCNVVGDSLKLQVWGNGELNLVGVYLIP